MISLAGVDGCRAGWFVVHVAGAGVGREVRWLVVAEFADVLALRPRPDFVALDMPIGLRANREAGDRGCDREARRLLGPRRSSVFSAPTRDVLAARDYEAVRRRGLSRQAFGILPKVREIDAVMTPHLQRRVREAHPELAFRRLAGAPMRSAKRTEAGCRERLRWLRAAWERAPQLYRQAIASTRRRDVARDDVFDALSLALVAERLANGHAERVPQRPARDERGLRMEIWF